MTAPDLATPLVLVAAEIGTATNGQKVFNLRNAAGLTVAEYLFADEAALIVRAVNSHAALVAALEGVIRVADRKTDEFDAARAALAFARGAAK